MFIAINVFVDFMTGFFRIFGNVNRENMGCAVHLLVRVVIVYNKNACGECDTYHVFGCTDGNIGITSPKWTFVDPLMRRRNKVFFLVTSYSIMWI